MALKLAGGRTQRGPGTKYLGGRRLRRSSLNLKMQNWLPKQNLRPFREMLSKSRGYARHCEVAADIRCTAST